ncbi:MAG: hypothetical protein N2512_08350 [Armatimonadetes bacterium]|nr:hypothetical protein [Armatimonadota bacterium]
MLRNSNDVERHNLEQVEMLNQRGGRTLSAVDLIEAGTLSVEATAFMLCAMSQGASVLTGALAGAAGKSTLLAAALCFLPPGERIVTVSSHTVVARALEHPANTSECFLAHEIGQGHFYGYIWGRTVREFFGLLETGRRIATCLHADTLAQTQEMLTGSPLFVDPGRLSLLGLIGYIRMAETPSGVGRRVTYLYGRVPGRGPQLAFRWRESDDTFEMTGDLETFGVSTRQFSLAAAFLADLVDAGVRLFEDVRKRVVAFYKSEGF